MSIKRLFDAVERRGDIGRRVAALVLPISNRPRVTSRCAGKIGLREPGEHTSGPNLASRDNVAHNPTLYTNSGKAAIGHPASSYQMVPCWSDGQLFRPPRCRYSVGAISPNGCYGISRRPRSFRLDVGRADHLSPLLGFFGNERPEIGR